MAFLFTPGWTYKSFNQDNNNTFSTNETSESTSEKKDNEDPLLKNLSSNEKKTCLWLTNQEEQFPPTEDVEWDDLTNYILSFLIKETFEVRCQLFEKINQLNHNKSYCLKLYYQFLERKYSHVPLAKALLQDIFSSDSFFEPLTNSIRSRQFEFQKYWNRAKEVKEGDYYLYFFKSEKMSENVSHCEIVVSGKPEHELYSLIIKEPLKGEQLKIFLEFKEVEDPWNLKAKFKINNPHPPSREFQHEFNQQCSKPEDQSTKYDLKVKNVFEKVDEVIEKFNFKGAGYLQEKELLEHKTFLCFKNSAIRTKEDKTLYYHANQINNFEHSKFKFIAAFEPSPDKLPYVLDLIEKNAKIFFNFWHGSNEGYTFDALFCFATKRIKSVTFIQTR